MTAQSFQCPSCGAPLMPEGNASVIRCPHCHMSVIVPEELRQDSEAEQWTTVLYDSFTTNDNNWLIGSQPSEYFDPLNRKIVDGRYRWEAELSRPNSISRAWLMGYLVWDFHLIVNGKHIMGSQAGSAWGMIFRIQDNQNHYSFRMTDSQSFAVSVQKDGQWSNLVDWTKTDTIKPNGVNQLEVLARGTHFIFRINGQVVSEVEDDHFGDGLVGLAIEGYTLGEKIIFDFIDVTLLEPRADAYNYSRTETRKATNSNILILCPYCMTPIHEEAEICPVCAQDTTRDAKLELTRAQYDAEPKKACHTCGAQILNLASVCPICCQRQL